MKLRVAMLAAGPALVAACASPARVASGRASSPSRTLHNLDPGVGTDESSRSTNCSSAPVNRRAAAVSPVATLDDGL